MACAAKGPKWSISAKVLRVCLCLAAPPVPLQFIRLLESDETGEADQVM